MTDQSAPPLTQCAPFAETDALRLVVQLKELRSKQLGLYMTVAQMTGPYSDPTDYRLPLYCDDLDAVNAKVARVNAALAALKDALA